MKPVYCEMCFSKYVPDKTCDCPYCQGKGMPVEEQPKKEPKKKAKK